MITNSATRDVFLDLHKSRATKKKKMYRLALGVAIDKTTAVYLGLFALLGGVILYDTMLQYKNEFQQMETFFSTYYITIWLTLILRSTILSFTKPGILYSSAELKMSLLPHPREQIWLLCALEKWIKIVVVSIIIVILLAIFTPLGIVFLSGGALLYVFTQVMMTVPQWKLYQRSIRYKLFVMMGIGVLAVLIRFAISTIHSSYVWFFTILAALAVANWVLSGKLFKNVNWSKVVQDNDLLIWNMWFINKMSETEIKPAARTGWFDNVRKSQKRRQPFVYQNSSGVFRRIWEEYLLEEKEQVIKMMGGITAVLVFLSFQGVWVQGVAIALAVFLFGKLSASFFTGRFTDRLLFSLPWDMEVWKRSFFSWLNKAGLLLCLPLIVVLFFGQEQWIWLPLQLLFYISAARYFANQQTDIGISVLSKKVNPMPFQEYMFITITFLFLIISIAFPVVSIFAVIILAKSKPTWFKRKHHIPT